MNDNTNELDELFGKSQQTWGMEERLLDSMMVNKYTFATQLALNGLNEATVLLSKVVDTLSPEQLERIGNVQHWLQWYGVNQSENA